MTHHLAYDRDKAGHPEDAEELEAAGAIYDRLMKEATVHYWAILAWGEMLGSDRSYIDQQKRLAEQDGAPQNAIYKRDDLGWQTTSTVTNPTTAAFLKEWAASHGIADHGLPA